jgi:hypothetical protein
MTAAAFSTYLVFRHNDVVIHDPLAKLKAFDVTPRTTRHFCRDCGTPLFNLNPETYPGLMMVYLGTIEAPEQHPPRIQIYCESQLPWLRGSLPGTSFERTPSQR